mmetsp:Transcript_5983/g.14577  ORF Transcript_5983/g.14577 Transcript_5983/m.14577 type:complete len:386 (+) Transcript_5983:86-1243(+)
MGRKEDGYNSVDTSGDRPASRARSWSSWLRNGVEDFRTEHLEGVLSSASRRARQGKEFVEESVPGFSRSLAAGSRPHILLFVLVLLSLFLLLHFFIIPPPGMNLVPAPALCASQDDMYDTATHLCQVGNKYAFWYLARRDWVQCASSLPAKQMLQDSADFENNYWYPFSKAKEVREFYDTCIPECATDEDTYHASKDLCSVTDSVLIQWMNGDGQTCAPNLVGEKAIRSATSSLDSPRGYWYAADAADKVRALLETCHSQCAKGDVMLHDKVHCQIMGTLANQFLAGQGGTCDRNLPARRVISAMGNTKDVVGAFMYPKTMGPQVELFYLSCMRGWERKGRATSRGLPHESETVKGKPLRDVARDDRRSKDVMAWDEAMSQDPTP